MIRLFVLRVEEVKLDNVFDVVMIIGEDGEYFKVDVYFLSS